MNRHFLTAMVAAANFVTGTCASAHAEGMGVRDLSDIVRASKEWWNSTGYLAVTCDEFVPGTDGEPAPNTTIIKYDAIIGPNRESVVRKTSLSPHGEKEINEIRENEETRNKLGYGRDGRLKHVATMSRRGEGTFYTNEAFIFTWLIMPAMQRLHDLISSGSGPDSEEIDGATYEVIRSTFRGNPLAIYCDPSRDHAIARIELGSKDPVVFQVDEFAESDNHIYPKRGRHGPKAKDPGEWRRFRVTSIDFNAQISASRFDVPEMAPGVLWENQITRTRGVLWENQITHTSRRVGARIGRQAEAAPDPSDLPGRNGIQAEESPIVARKPFSWSPVLIGFFAVGTILAVFAWWRSQHRIAAK
jgi:hypothetical protein